MEYLPAWMFLALTILLMAGFPVTFTLLGTAIVFGWIGFGWTLFNLLPLRIWGVMSNVTLMAVPLFVFMGVMLERSGLAEELLDTMGLVFGRLRGGLAIAVVIVGALLGASTGIVGATVVTMGLLAVPTMLRRGYQKELATGTVSASGTLGQIIPPSIVLVLIGDIVGDGRGDDDHAIRIPYDDVSRKDRRIAAANRLVDRNGLVVGQVGRARRRARVDQPVARPQDGAAECQGDAEPVGLGRAGKPALGEEHDDPGVAHRDAGERPSRQRLAQHRHGEQRQRDRPGVVQRLGDLRRQAVVSLEKNDVIKEGIEDTEAGRLDEGPAVDPPASLDGCRGDEDRGRDHGAGEEQLQRRQDGETELETGRYRRPQQHRAAGGCKRL